jgi:hypothetical protein
MHRLHHLASGANSEDVWELDVRRRLVLTFRVAKAAPVRVTVAVGSARHPVENSFFLRAIDGEDWIVAPAKYVVGGRYGFRIMMADIHPSAVSTSFLLTNCPASDADILWTL